jgi:hypothetical protein
MASRLMNASPESERRESGIPLLIAGAALFLLLHLFFVLTWERWFAWMKVDQAWWMNSGRSMVVTAVAVFAAALVLGLRRRASLLAGGAWMLLGLTGAMVGVLMFVGPGNIWPIVLVAGGGILGVSVAAAVLVAAVVRRVVGIGPPASR